VVGEENVMIRRLIIRGAPAGIAALALGLGACDAHSTAEEGPAADAATSTPASSPTTTPTPAPVSTPAGPAPTDKVTYAPAPGEVVSIPRDDREAVVRPGRYALRLTRKLGYEVDVPDTRFADEGVYLHTPRSPGVFLATTADATTRIPRHPCTDLTGVPVGPTAADLTKALAAQPVLVTSAPHPVTLGGAAGYYLEVLVPTNLDEAACDAEVQLFRTGATTMAWEQGYLARWWILDVHGVRVVVMNICDVSCSPKNMQTLTTMAESITFSPGT
jgi:hypothetical protein